MTDQLRNPTSSTSTSSPSNSDPNPPPILCAQGCGFFGNIRTDSLCSKCYRSQLEKTVAEQEVSDDLQPPSPTVIPAAPAPSPCLQPTLEGDTPSEQSLISPVQLESTPTDVTMTASITPIVDESEPVSTVFYEKAVDILPSLIVTPPPVVPVATESVEKLIPSTSILQITNATSSTNSASPAKKARTRCQVCSKLVGLTYFACRCDENAKFCVTHRYPHAHNCTFNHKTHHAGNISKMNPVVKNDQFEKI